MTPPCSIPRGNLVHVTRMCLVKIDHSQELLLRSYPPYPPPIHSELFYTDSVKGPPQGHRRRALLWPLPQAPVYECACARKGPRPCAGYLAFILLRVLRLSADRAFPNGT